MTKDEHMKDLIENWSQAEFWLTYHKVVLRDQFELYYRMANALEYANVQHEDGITTLWLQGTVDYVDGLVNILTLDTRAHVVSIGEWVLAGAAHWR